MTKYQNLISDYPEKKAIYCSVSYFLFSFVALTFALSLFGLGYDIGLKLMTWFEVLYHIVNAIVAFVIFAEYIKDNFFTVTLDVKKIVISVLVAAVIILAFGYGCLVVGSLFHNTTIAAGLLPITEIELYMYPAVMVWEKPIIGTICLVLLAPITIGCLFYATVFAPICADRPWLAYLAIVGYLAIPRIANALTFWDAGEQLTIYLLQLPIHLIACRLYQKTDTVWAPIFLHVVVNLAACLLFIYPAM